MTDRDKLAAWFDDNAGVEWVYTAPDDLADALLASDVLRDMLNEATLKHGDRCYSKGYERGRAEVKAAVEAVLIDCDRRTERTPDRVLQFWVTRLRNALVERDGGA